MNVFHHTKVAIALSIVSFILLLLSIVPSISEKINSILQGISTGLLSGIALLLITGVKTQERCKFQEMCEAIRLCNLSLANIISTCGIFCYDTGFEAGKPLSSQISFEKAIWFYSACQNEYETLKSINADLLPEDAKNDLAEYIGALEGELRFAEEVLHDKKKHLDMQYLTLLRDSIHVPLWQANKLYRKFQKTESVLQKEIIRLDNSFF